MRFISFSLLSSCQCLCRHRYLAPRHDFLPMLGSCKEGFVSRSPRKLYLRDRLVDVEITGLASSFRVRASEKDGVNKGAGMVTSRGGTYSSAIQIPTFFFNGVVSLLFFHPKKL